MTTSLRACALAAADAIEAARDELCQLDAVAGDGDHGVTMALAARAVRQQLELNPDAAGADLLAKAALGVGSVGGAIGPIYATALMRASSALRGLPIGPDGPTVGQIRACAAAALLGITSLGGAKEGDKTVVDAIAPAVDALGAAEEQGTTVDAALESSVTAARAGAGATRDMVATLGRASRLGERSRGWADPGASSFVVVIDAAVYAYLSEPEGDQA